MCVAVIIMVIPLLYRLYLCVAVTTTIGLYACRIVPQLLFTVLSITAFYRTLSVASKIMSSQIMTASGIISTFNENEVITLEFITERVSVYRCPLYRPHEIWA